MIDTIIIRHWAFYLNKPLIHGYQLGEVVIDDWWKGVRDGRYKYCSIPLAGAGGWPYDHKTDIKEQKNLIDSTGYR